jgi:hypothetical protein
MATYNTTTGMGGLDGSIQFELDRPEVGIILSTLASTRF